MSTATERRSRRRTRPAAAEPSLIDQLNTSVEALIRENTALKKQLARLQSSQSTTVSGPGGRALVSLQRRVERALNVGAPAPAPSKRRTRRRITDPGVLEIRRQALAKARQARAEKLAAAKQAAG